MSAAGRAEPDWPLYSAMLDYLEAFPEVTHDPKEDRFLFPRLRAAHAAAGPVIDKVAAEHYASFMWRHMALEESEILPLATQFLSAADWQAIDAAFLVNGTERHQDGG